ncbi:MAG: hypothetical protein Q9M36_02770 [Sulfurovum sp.]|nr:hypothetical protein [Sulfurovum sp.]
MAKQKININDVLGSDIEKPITTFAEADKKKKEVAILEGVNKGGRPMKGKTKANKKVAYHIDAESWEKLEKMIDFPKEKSVNAVCKRLVEAMLKA